MNCDKKDLLLYAVTDRSWLNGETLYSQVEKALKAGADILGVNNRNLENFQVDMETSVRLRKLVPPETVFVSESGIRTREDIMPLEEAGVDGVLIGETFMRSPDKKAMLAQLKGQNG